MGYRDIIKVNIEQAILKRDKSSAEKEKERWNTVVSQLIVDLKDFETNGKERWENSLGMNYQRNVSPDLMSIDDIFKHFFEGGFGF